MTKAPTLNPITKVPTLNPMTKSPYTQSYDKCPYTQRKIQQLDNIKNATNNFDYITIADRLGTVSLSNSSHPSGVGNRFTGAQPSH